MMFKSQDQSHGQNWLSIREGGGERRRAQRTLLAAGNASEQQDSPEQRLG